jgi:AsmA protein
MRVFWWILAGLFGGLALAVVALVLVRGADAKREVQALASEALGMEFQVQGALRLRLFPALHVTMEGVRIRNGGSEIATASHASIGVELLPLLRREVQIGAVGLRDVTITVERLRSGRFNFETSSKRDAALPRTDVVRLALTNAHVSYADAVSGRRIEAQSCDLDVRDVKLQESLETLSFAGVVSCGEIRAGKLVLSEIRAPIRAQAGVLDITPLTLRLLEGKGSGRIRADLSGAVPQYQLQYSLAQFHLPALNALFASATIGDGLVDFSADLTAKGNSGDDLLRSAMGKISLQSRNLVLEIGDIDKQLSRYESSQSFNLVDAGAFFLAGPAGLAVTKGYNFASLSLNARGRTEVRALVSEWEVEQGVARAADVAMATRKHRLALTGAVDLIRERFESVTLALVDTRGCARLEQKISGPLSKPDVQKPSVLKAVSGPARNLFGRATSVFGRKCKVFYSGSVAAQ